MIGRTTPTERNWSYRLLRFNPIENRSTATLLRWVGTGFELEAPVFCFRVTATAE